MLLSVRITKTALRTRAVVIVKERGGVGEAATALSKIEGIIEIFMVTGEDDLIAIADALSESELKWLQEKLSTEPSIKSFRVNKVVGEWKR